MIKMEELRAMFEALGFDEVKSYINSGNIAFDSRKLPPEKLSAKIETAIADRFDKQIPVIIREQEDFKRILSNNPFEGKYGSHKEMHVLFLKEGMPEDKAEQLAAAAIPGEEFYPDGREIYCHLQNGVAESLLGKGFLEKKLKIVYTGRNWRTVEKLAEL